MRTWRAELWTPVGAPLWRERRREAAERLIAWHEADDELKDRTEERIARDIARLGEGR